MPFVPWLQPLYGGRAFPAYPSGRTRCPWFSQALFALFARRLKTGSLILASSSWSWRVVCDHRWAVTWLSFKWCIHRTSHVQEKQLKTTHFVKWNVDWCDCLISNFCLDVIKRIFFTAWFRFFEVKHWSIGQLRNNLNILCNKGSSVTCVWLDRNFLLSCHHGTSQLVMIYIINNYLIIGN